MGSRQTSEARLLAEINAEIPPDIDWKQGAIDYLRELVGQKGEAEHWFHFVKPFVAGPDFATMWVDILYFLDVLKTVDLPPRSRVIDVGCGPGWTTQWMCKLGHEVIAVDISREMLEIAEQRLATERYPPFQHEPLAYELHEHDIEAAPLGLAEPVPFALFESSLHHFYDPISVVRNVAADLTDDGVIAVIEAAAPAPGTIWHRADLELMRTYHTIERPYTRAQMLELLALTGFEWCEFYAPVNGCFPRTADAIGQLSMELSVATHHQLVIASRTREGLARIVGDRPRTWRDFATGWQFAAGFYGEEADPEGRAFRWCRTQGFLHFDLAGSYVLSVSTHGLGATEVQTVYALMDNIVVDAVTLTNEQRRADVKVEVRSGATLVLQSDRSFSPAWCGSQDARLLSFQVDAPGTT